MIDAKEISLFKSNFYEFFEWSQLKNVNLWLFVDQKLRSTIFSQNLGSHISVIK